MQDFAVVVATVTLFEARGKAYTGVCHLCGTRVTRCVPQTPLHRLQETPYSALHKNAVLVSLREIGANAANEDDLQRSRADSQGGPAQKVGLDLQVDVRNFRGVMGTRLLAGDRGVEQTINLIRHAVDDAVKDPAVNSAAIDMVRGVSQFDDAAKAQAIYAAVATRFTYVKDPVGPFGPKELVRTVRLMLQQWAGDCDCASTLIASLLGTIGIPSRLVTIASDPAAPGEFSHIYPEAEVYPGVWACMDIARPGAAFGVSPPRYFRKRVWSLSDPGFRDVAGARCSSLAGYALLGDDAGINPVAQDLAASASLASGIAQIVSAGGGQPTIPYSYSQPNIPALNPYASFYGPGTPGNIAPGAGYAQVTATGDLSMSPTTKVIIGLIAAVILWKEFR